MTCRYLLRLPNLESQGKIDFIITDVPNGPREDESWTSTVNGEPTTRVALLTKLMSDDFTVIAVQDASLAIVDGQLFTCSGKTKSQAKAAASRLVLLALGTTLE